MTGFGEPEATPVREAGSLPAALHHCLLTPSSRAEHLLQPPLLLLQPTMSNGPHRGARPAFFPHSHPVIPTPLQQAFPEYLQVSLVA